MDDATGDSPTVAPALADAGQAIAGRYRVRARLGRGASKEVYLAYDERLDREVALALVVGAGTSDAARARVEREARVTGRLGDHPNVITVYDTGEIDGVPYLVLRAMSGGSLADALRTARPTVTDTIRIGRELAAALAHAHAHGVVHRDVKPDNVWLAADGSAALGDFGVAYEVGADRLTAEGHIVGTVRYLSPEQIQGEEIDAAADLYALGVTLYELVTGSPPFTATDHAHVLSQHLMAVPVPPSQHEPAVPEALERLILGLLAKRPAERPASAAAVGEALARIPADGPAARRTQGAARRLVSVLAARAEVGDPEALHEVLDRCAMVVEEHGGTVERFPGETLLGLFGAGESHEDDPLRAARAAAELRAAVSGLRLGIETGEVFLAFGPRGATIATGAAISAAGELAERAADGEILLGENVRHALSADARIDASTGRLLELQLDEPALLRVPGTPFVGRARALEDLHAAFARACEEHACRLVTVTGPPGIGKSRLAGEFVAGVGDRATVLAGRCPAYGEGTAFRAIADVVGGLDIEELLAGDPQAIRGLLAAAGLSDEPVQVEETSWALRRLLERLARDRPLVVAVEDIHWAQPALLEVLDHAVALSSGSPILLLCLARPDLLESRPGWAAPQPRRSILVLEALPAGEARELAEHLGAGDLAGRIAARAEGNPLFVEQLVAVGAGGGDLPVSIQAVLAARIDRLEPGERTLLQRAAVEGREFHAGALAALVPAHERRGLASGLVALARKGLIVADRGEEAFRFTHALIREAAYAGLPKLLRAELHAGVARWLEPSGADEVIGYHLEQACRLAGELRRPPEHTLAERAVTRFEAAARAALGRGDPAAAAGLLERAVALAGDAEARGALLPALGAALFEAGRVGEAARILDEAIAAAPDPLLEARARVERELVRLEIDTGAGTEQAARVADEVMPLLDRPGQCRAWVLRAHAAWNAGQVERADAAWREAAEAGDELFAILSWRATAAVLGPTPVDEAIRRCEEFRAIVAASPVGVASTSNPLASLHAMRGELEPAESYLAEANGILQQLGGIGASVSHHEALVRLLGGRPDLAEVPLRAGVERLASMSDGGFLATTTAMLAQVVYAQGRFEEAGELCTAAAETAAADDIVTQVIWRGVKAKVLARAGRCAEAEALAREAIALVEPTDLLSHHGDAMLDLAEVLRACAREFDPAAAAALELFERKGNAVGAARARALLSNRHGAT